MNIVKKGNLMIPWDIFWVHFLLFSLEGKILFFAMLFVPYFLTVSLLVSFSFLQFYITLKII